MKGVEGHKSLRNLSGPEQERLAESYIPLSEVFDIVYPGLDPKVFELTEKILANELVRLKENGIEATWVRSGARRLAVHLAQNRSDIDVLRSQWGIFKPELLDKPEIGRRRLATIAKEMVDQPYIYNEQTIDVVRKYTSLPDMDVKIGSNSGDRNVHADSELDYFLEESVMPQIKDAVTNGPPEVKGNRVQVAALYAERDILFEADVGKISSANKRNAAIRFKNGKNEELFGLQIGTMPETVHGAFVDNRDSTTPYSNEEISFPMTAKDGRVMINISGLANWIQNLDKKISLNRNLKVETAREAVLALRSARIACHMFPASKNLPGLIDSLYEPDVLEHMKKVFADLTESVSLDPILESAIYREFISMIETDPYFALVWAIESGAAKFFLGEKGDGILINSLLSERMTCQTQTHPTNGIEQVPLPTFLRAPNNLHKDRDAFLAQAGISESGVRMVSDSLYQQFRQGPLQGRELNNLIKLFSDPDTQSLYMEKVSQELDTAYHSSIFLDSLGMLLKYAEGAFPRSAGKNKSFKSEYIRVFGIVMQEITVMANEKSTFTTRQVQLLFDELLGRSKISFYRGELETLYPLSMLVRTGVITRWKDSFVLTPRKDLQALVIPYWKALQEEPDYFHYRNSAVDLLYQILSEDTRCAAKFDDATRLARAEFYVDKVAPRTYFNIFGLLRSPPTATAIEYKTGRANKK